MKFIIITLCILIINSKSTVFAKECPAGTDGIPCLGSNIARNLVHQVLGSDSSKPIELSEGVLLVKVNNFSFDKARDLSASSVYNNLRKFISSYEVRFRLSDVFNGQNDISDGDFQEEARKGSGLGVSGFGGSGLGGGGGSKGGKKGGGGLAAMMLMMAGMMKVMALGALGALAMKALTVSSLAFMLSAIVGLKKLLSKKDDDDGGHVVQVVGHGGGDHHRRAFLVQDSNKSHQLAFRGQRRR